MENKEKSQAIPLTNEGSDGDVHQKTYSKPRLIELGDLRSITLGSSPQTFQDSYTGTFP